MCWCVTADSYSPFWWGLFRLWFMVVVPPLIPAVSPKTVWQVLAFLLEQSLFGGRIKKKNSSQQLRCVLSDPVYLTWWLWTWLHLHHLKVRGFSCDSQCVFWPLLFHFCSPWCAHWPVVPWPLLLTFANKSIYLTSEGLLQSPPSNTLTYNLFHRCEGAVMCKTGVFFTDWMKLQPLCLCRCLNEFLNLTTIFVWVVYEMSIIWLNCQICAKTCSLSTWFRSTAKNNDVWTIFLYEDMLFVPNASQQVSSVNVSKHIV